MDSQESRLTKAELARLRLYAKKFRAWWDDAGKRLAKRGHSASKPAVKKEAA